jgi:hypothetical protein
VAKKKESGGNEVVSRLNQALDGRVDYDAFLAKLGARDRVNVERHVVAAEAEPDPTHAKLWKRLAQTLATLAPHAAQTTGQQAVSFFVADGKYRMQVFALEDQRDSKLVMYGSDVTPEAIKAGILQPPPKGESGYTIVAAPTQKLTVESLDAQNTPNPSVFFKHMLGWNRKAMRITLTMNATEQQVVAAEQLCALAAQRTAAAAPAAPAATTAAKK